MIFFVLPLGLFFFMFVFFALALTGFVLSYVFFTGVCVDYICYIN